MTPHECILACYALASSGHLEEAKANLLRNAPCLECGEGTDLLARVELALGNEGEARRLWKEAIAKGLDGTVARKALAALDSVAWRHRGMVRFFRHFLRFAAILAIGILLGVWWTKGMGASIDTGVPENGAPPKAEEVPEAAVPSSTDGGESAGIPLANEPPDATNSVSTTSEQQP